ncbi:MAG: DUF2188 domain-containing protein [Bacteroidetes bacterium]|nr:DUF2188 domain-containing protein [Bacteroidota bacterium]
MRRFHLTPVFQFWLLKEEGDKTSYKVFKTNKKTAIKKCAEELNHLGSGVSLIIHKKDGKFQEERTYPRKADPRSSAG